MARRGRDNFRFTTVELSALVLSFTVTSALVFLLGFYIGRRVAAEHAPVAENVARVPIGPPPADTAPPRSAPVPPAAQSSGPQAAALPRPALPPAQSSAPQANAPKPTSQAPQPSTPLTPPAKVGGPPLPPAGQGAQPPAGRPAPAQVPAAPPTAQAAPGIAYTVQVLATRNRNEAENLAANLKKKGYGAYIVQADDAGGTWYRVRVGNFETSDAARRLAERASRELGLTQAYVSPLSSGSR